MTEANHIQNQWDRYIQYLLQWAEEHSDKLFEGRSPACYEEFCDCECNLEDPC